MKAKCLLKTLSLLALAPIIAVFPLVITGCSSVEPPPPPQPEKTIKIIEPAKKEESSNLDETGSAEVIFLGFKYDGIDVIDDLSVDGNFSQDSVTFEYSIKSFDIYNKTFNVAVKVSNGVPVNNLIGRFNFNYKDKSITPETQSDFSLSLLPPPIISIPETRSAEKTIQQGEVSIIFSGFSCSGIGDPSDLVVIFSKDPTIGRIDHCKVVNFKDNKFDVKLDFVGVAAEILVGNFNFYYQSVLIPCETGDFTCILDRESGKPNFETDSWEQVIEYANDGLASLQEYYGIASFVGLKRNISIASEKIGTLPTDYPVTVIGQNVDHFASGTFVALTFQFDNVISSYDDSSEYIPDNEIWGTDAQYWWYNPKEKEDNECALRQFLYNNVLPRFDVAVRENIKPVVKKTIGADEAEATVAKDTIWCLSQTEIGFVGPDEGSCYEFYTSCYGQKSSDLWITTDIDKSDPVNWWLRSFHGGCTTTGEVRTLPNRGWCIRPCFCI